MFGHVLVGNEGFVPESTNIFQSVVHTNQDINSMGSVLQTMNVVFGSPSVNNSTYITYGLKVTSSIYLNKPWNILLVLT